MAVFIYVFMYIRYKNSSSQSFEIGKHCYLKQIYLTRCKEPDMQYLSWLEQNWELWQQRSDSSSPNL